MVALSATGMVCACNQSGQNVAVLSHRADRGRGHADRHGLYFILLRPSLLPEDVRYMGLSAAQLDAVRPQLEVWLTQVFRVMGGYVLATAC
jgi:hypothetical protein